MNNMSSHDYWQREAVKFATLYDGKIGLSLKRLVASFLDARTNSLVMLADIGPDDVVLDLGCGSGVHVKLFSPRCKRIVGVDYSNQMISAAEEQLRNSSVQNWEFKVGDAHQIPYPDASFDWILSMGLLDYVSSPERVLQECYRVLREPGHIVFTIPKTPSLFFFLRTSLGNVLKGKLFDLPPITNTITFSRLEGLLRSLNLHLTYARSIWTAMWMVKASKTGY